MLEKNHYSLNTNVSFNVKSVYEGHHKMTYKGVECVKCPFDYVIYQMIINEIRPDLIIEIGNNKGGSALYMADLLDLIGHGVIHTIDIDNRSHYLAKAHKRINFFHEGWENYEVIKSKNFEKILVIEDSSHDYVNTLNVMERFGPLVCKDSYLIVEDGIVNALNMKKRFAGGPIKAIKEFLRKHQEFKIDYKWTNMFGKNATFNVIGYLKRM